MLLLPVRGQRLRRRLRADDAALLNEQPVVGAVAHGGRGHLRRMGRGHEKTKNWKKAIVSLKDGDSIDFFEGT